MKIRKAVTLASFAGILLLAASGAIAATDLNEVVDKTAAFLKNAAKLINIIAALVGAYFVFSGFMAWKKSADERAGGQIGFKEVVVPIVAGVFLILLSAFIMATSSTFGFAPGDVNEVISRDL